MKTSNKIYFGIGAVALVVLLFLWNGCHQRQLGRDEVLTSAKIAQVDKKIAKDDNNLEYWKSRALKTSDSLKDKNKAFDFQLFLLTSFQTKANQQRTSYEKTIKSLSDSIKNFKIDSTQLAGGDDNLLIAEHDYPIALAQLDSCGKDVEIWKNKYEGSELELSICNEYSDAKDTLANDTKVKTDLTEMSLNKKVRHKNFWIFAGWGTAIGETALAVKYFFFPTKQ